MSKGRDDASPAGGAELGIVDVKELYGVGAVRYDKRIDMVVELAAWREGMQVDRLGLDERYYTLLKVGYRTSSSRFGPERDLVDHDRGGSSKPAAARWEDSQTPRVFQTPSASGWSATHTAPKPR